MRYLFTSTLTKVVSPGNLGDAFGGALHLIKIVVIPYEALYIKELVVFPSVVFGSDAVVLLAEI